MGVKFGRENTHCIVYLTFVSYISTTVFFVLPVFKLDLSTFPKAMI